MKDFGINTLRRGSYLLLYGCWLSLKLFSTRFQLQRLYSLDTDGKIVMNDEQGTLRYDWVMSVEGTAPAFDSRD
jgi:hypothetical protein